MSAGILGTDLAGSAAVVAQSLGTGLTSAATARAAAATPKAATTASSTPGDISSNDFLTLLVTEMKNQDPTQPTDPNAYIQQLTEVNSLQQLIAINQDLTPGTSGSGGSTPPVTPTTGS